MPSYAVWFDMNAVDEIEQRALPDLTASPGAIEQYKSLRNRMISLYRDIPGRPLDAVDCLRHLAADPSIVCRVHAFLNFWGIINTESQGRVRFQKTLLMLSEPPPSTAPVGEAAGAAGKQKKMQSRGYSKCAVSRETLQRICFALKSDPSYMLSPLSYLNSMMPAYLSSSDFIRRVNDDKLVQTMPSHDDWTEEETRYLLDAILKVGENWDVVAQIVKTKSMEQCLLHFARLPIADRYVQDVMPLYDADKLAPEKLHEGEGEDRERGLRSSLSTKQL